MYLGDFIDFQNFVNFYKKLPDFWAKTPLFFAYAAQIWENNFQRKVYEFFQKMVKLTQFMVEMFLRVPSRTSSMDFLIF